MFLRLIGQGSSQLYHYFTTLSKMARTARTQKAKNNEVKKVESGRTKRAAASKASKKTKAQSRAEAEPGKKSTKKSKAGRSKKAAPEKEFEIEKIVDHRIKGAYVEYCVTWKGYDETETDWLPEEEFGNAAKILNAYKYDVTGQKEGDGEFEIEEIIAHREIGGTRLYLVHWHGYDHPVFHSELVEKELESAGEILEDYLKAHDLEPAGSGKKAKKGGKAAKAKKGKKAKAGGDKTPSKRNRKRKSESVESNDSLEVSVEVASEKGEEDDDEDMVVENGDEHEEPSSSKKSSKKEKKSRKSKAESEEPQSDE